MDRGPLNYDRWGIIKCMICIDNSEFLQAFFKLVLAFFNLVLRIGYDPT